MFRLFALSLVSVFTILCSSCGCCTSDSKTPPLRRLPKFQEIEAAPANEPVQVQPTK